MNSPVFQLIVLPKGDVENPSGISIYCPFTQILAEGDNYEDAVQNWTIQAQEKLGAYLVIPKQQDLMQRKVWCGFNNQTKQTWFFIDFAPEIRKHPSFVETTSRTVKDSLDDLDMAMFDWKVPCSSILHINQHSVIPDLISLTPNVIN